MIQPQTQINIADNTGARKIMCICVLGSRKKYADVGDIIVGVVKEATPRMPVKKSDIVRAVIVRTRSDPAVWRGFGHRDGILWHLLLVGDQEITPYFRLGCFE